MKKLILLALSIITLAACEGDRGPQGPIGPPGQDGLIGTTIELKVNFGNQNQYLYDFAANGIEVFEDEAILVYHSLDSEVENNNVSVWTPLPRTFYFDDGRELAYTYNHTFYDVEIMLGGSVNLNNLAPEFYQNQWFRIVIIPSARLEDPFVNTSSYQALKTSIEAQGLQLKEVN